MLDVLSPLITEADYVSNELLDIILINIVDPYKTQRKNAFALAKELVSKTSDTLEPYLQQVINTWINPKSNDLIQIKKDDMEEFAMVTIYLSFLSFSIKFWSLERQKQNFRSQGKFMTSYMSCITYRQEFFYQSYHN